MFEPGAEGTLQYAVSVPKDLKNIYALEEGKVNWYFKAADKNPKGLRTDAPGTGDTNRFVALLCAFSVSSFLLLILKKTVR